MTAQEVEEHPYTMCDSCGGVDRAPRHLHYVAEGEGTIPPEIGQKAVENAVATGEPDLVKQIVAEIQDTTTLNKHLDCCMSDGCPDGSCNAIHAATPAPEDKPLQNEKLAAFITDDKNKVSEIGQKLNEQRYEAQQQHLAAEAERGEQ